MSKRSPKGAGRSAAKPAPAVPPAAIPPVSAAKPVPAAKPVSAAPAPAPAAKPAAPPTHEQIARLAHDIWAQRGRPSGQDIDIWCEAERRLARTS